MSPRVVGLIALGGAAGAAVRWAATSLTPEASQLFTILVLNIAGAAFAGWLTGRGHAPQDDGTVSDLWAAGAVGFCGGVTTFATFAVQIATRLDDGAVASGLAFTLMTAVAAVGAAITGFRMASAIR